MIKSKKFLTAALSTSALIFTISGAHAAGFYIQEQSVKGLGTAFAGSTTSIDDASTIYFNPAGMTKLDPRIQGNLGVHLLLPDANIDDTGTSSSLAGVTIGGDPGNPYDPSPVPNAFLAAPVDVYGNQLWLGVGVTAPFGLASEYDVDDFNAFDSTDTELMTINLGPAVAYEINDQLSIGGGVDIQYVDAKLEGLVDTGVLGLGTGISKLEGDDVSFGYNLGLQFRPRTDTEIGLHYRSQVKHELDGSISLSGLAAGNFDEAGTADLDLPNIATLGVAHDINDRFRVMGQVTWFGWSSFDEIDGVTDSGANDPDPVVQDYDNTYAFAVGAEYDLKPDLTLRAGYQFDQTPTNDEFRTTRTPDGDRNWFSAGATYALNENLSFDFAATYIHIADEEINLQRNAVGGINRVNVLGDTEGSVGIVAAAINYKF
ncbi:MAG: porin [Pseudomonadota bacterium]